MNSVPSEGVTVEYEVEASERGDVVWIHASDGSTVGRFGRMGVDLHTTVTEQLAGAPQCRFCTHGRVTRDDWALFREKALEFWGLDVAEDLVDPAMFGATW